LTLSDISEGASNLSLPDQEPRSALLTGVFLYPATIEKEDVMNRQVYENIALFTILFAVGIAYASCLQDFAIGA